MGKIATESLPKREAIMLAAECLFAQKGYEETTIADIARAAGIAVGTVYLYFRNKHEVYTAVSLAIEAKLGTTFRDPALLALPFKQMIRTIIDELFRKNREHIHLVSLLQIDMQSSDEVVQHEQANEDMCEAIAAILQLAIDRGELAPFNTEMYAQMLNLTGTALLHQCFAIERGKREEEYHTYFLEFVERLCFGPSLQEGKQSQE